MQTNCLRMVVKFIITCLVRFFVSTRVAVSFQKLTFWWVGNLLLLRIFQLFSKNDTRKMVYDWSPWDVSESLTRHTCSFSMQIINTPSGSCSTCIGPIPFLVRWRKRPLNLALVSFAVVCAFLCGCLSFYPRDAMLARVIVIATCLSVCLSVTSRCCVKTTKASCL